MRTNFWRLFRRFVTPSLARELLRGTKYDEER
jgi:hypothetical protein